MSHDCHDSRLMTHDMGGLARLAQRCCVGEDLALTEVRAATRTAAYSNDMY